MRKWFAGLASGIVAALGLVVLAPTTLSAQDTGERAMSNESSQGLVEALRAEDLTVYASILEASGLAASFSDDEPLTFFVPTNTAFADVAEDAVQGEQAARAFVSYLTVKGRVAAPRDADPKAVESIDPMIALRGISLETDDEGRPVVSDPNESAHVGRTLEIGPHVIHVIDGVLLPAADPMN